MATVSFPPKACSFGEFDQAPSDTVRCSLSRLVQQYLFDGRILAPWGFQFLVFFMGHKTVALPAKVGLRQQIF